VKGSGRGLILGSVQVISWGTEENYDSVTADIPKVLPTEPTCSVS
jgi:hypothetical protein